MAINFRYSGKACLTKISNYLFSNVFSSQSQNQKKNETQTPAGMEEVRLQDVTGRVESGTETESDARLKGFRTTPRMEEVE